MTVAAPLPVKTAPNRFGPRLRATRQRTLSSSSHVAIFAGHHATFAVGTSRRPISRIGIFPFALLPGQDGAHPAFVVRQRFSMGVYSAGYSAPM